MENLSTKNWHSLDEQEILDTLESDKKKGLHSSTLQQKKELFGKNQLKQKKQDSKFKIFLMQFHSALVYILLGATIITALLQEWIDSGVIFAVVIINVIIGYLEEVKAAEAIESLKNMMISNTTVIRDGKTITISSLDIVPGDIILLESGAKVPADLRLLEIKDLKVDESMLTGESLPAEKSLESLEEDTTLNDRINMVFSGTYVTSGRAKGIVVATANDTQIGKISTLIEQSVQIETPLTKKIDSFSKILLYVILTLAALTFTAGILRDNSIVDMFMASVALAVGAIPEGLPAAVTITLAIGVSRMARKNAIIRKLPAVETLGSVTTICSDKTGTLTQNKMTITDIYCEEKKYKVEGSHNTLEGDFLLDGSKIAQFSDTLLETLKAGYLCNEASLIKKENSIEISGDPTEAALLISALKSDLNENVLKENYEKLDILPFESQNQYMATLHLDKENNTKAIYIKGSVEKVLPKCRIKDEKSILQIVEEYASMGLRVLVLAKKETSSDTIKNDELENEFIFLGLQAMMDPPREEAIEAVKECLDAGINIIMITGDHAHTAFSISKMLSITNEKSDFNKVVLQGSEILKLSDEELKEKVATVKVFARVEPEQKLRIVNALQARGEIIAMTGDGVNDAPALKQADIGIAMGKGGTEVAKEASDMVLSDDNFQSIANAVKEGRNVFDNLVKFITWTLPTNLGEGLVILSAIMLGMTLPILPVQILWINMSTAILLGLMLVFEPKELDIMQRPPRDPKESILTRSMVIQMLVVGFYLLIAAYSMFEYYLDQGYTIEYARTIAVNIFVFTELFYLFSCKQLQLSIFKTNLLNNKFLLLGVGNMILFQIAFTHLEMMNTLFESEPLELKTWIHILAVSMCVIFVVELKMLLERTLNKKVIL